MMCHHIDLMVLSTAVLSLAYKTIKQTKGKI